MRNEKNYKRKMSAKCNEKKNQWMAVANANDAS